MKKIIIVFVLLFHNLFAFDKDTTLKVYNKIFTSIFPQKDVINIYVLNQQYIDLFKNSHKFKIVYNIKKASVAIVTSQKELEEIQKIKTKNSIIIFATQEKLLFDNKLTIGAFYWKKGRSQLLFVKDRLDKYHIKLPNEYDKFIIEL